MISKEDVIAIHNSLINDFGGSYGIRDEDSLDSALHRPFHTFDKVDLYPNPQDKAAAIIESILINHPFIDGNKRTGYFLMRGLLLSNSLDIKASEEEKFQFVINIASGKLKYDQILDWIESRLVKLI